MQEIIHEILEFIKEHSNQRMASYFRSNGAVEAEVYGTPQKDLKKLYKKYKDHHELALKLFELDNLEARSLATMISDLDKMDEDLFNKWISMSDSFWLNNNQLAVTLAGHKDAQIVAQKWINNKEKKKVDAGFFTYCWLLGNRNDEEFSDEAIKNLLEIVEKTENRTQGMEYFVEIVGVSYLPLHKEAVDLVQKLKIESAINGINKATEKGRLGFKRNYLRC